MVGRGSLTNGARHRRVGGKLGAGEALTPIAIYCIPKTKTTERERREGHELGKHIDPSPTDSYAYSSSAVVQSMCALSQVAHKT